MKSKLSQYKKIFSNFAYNLSYQILSFLLPIVTVPYIAKVFTQSLVGQNAVIQAQVSLFVLFGTLGITFLGPREIAKCAGDESAISFCFSKIYKLQLYSHLLTLGAYIVFCLICESDLKLALVYIFFIIASATDISWVFMGLEDFRAIAVRNFISKIASFFLLILMVKKDSDIYTYILTIYGPQILMNLYMWFEMKKKKIVLDLKIKLDVDILKDALVLFLPQIASSVFTFLDKIVLGLFSPYESVAIYEHGQVLIRLFLAIVPSFSKVMMPRMSAVMKEKNSSQEIELMKMSANIVMFLSFAVFFGVIACAKMFISCYLPASYFECSTVIVICSPIILAVSGANLVSVQYLIPSGHQWQYTISIIISACTNLILNFCLAPFYGIWGVCIGSVIAETLGFAIQLFYFSKLIDIKAVFSNLGSYVFSGIIMYLVLHILEQRLAYSWLNFAVLVLVGAFVYSCVIGSWLLIKRKMTTASNSR